MSGGTNYPIRVLLIDDHAIVRAGLRMLIESDPDLVVTGEAAGSADALMTAAEPADVILLDLDLGGESGLDLLPRLVTLLPKARIIVLTGIIDEMQHQQAVRLGAMGLVLKHEVARTLLTAIHKVNAGEVWLNRAMLARVINTLTHPAPEKPPDPEAAKIGSLTEREREVIRLVGEGLRNKQIGERLFISEKTVRHYLTSVFDKLDVKDRLELMIYAFQHNLARMPVDPSQQ